MRNIGVRLLALFILLFILDMSCEVFTINSKVEAHELVQEESITTISLVRFFLDGEFSIEIVPKNVESFNELKMKYSNWELVEIKEGTIYFQKYVDDISPLLKTNGYFGITTEGVLSIYNGEPKQQKIIQSFFQIDIEKLETKYIEELTKGIPIQTKEHYVQVINTFKAYSLKDKG